MDRYTRRTLRSLAGEILSWKSLLVFVFIIIIAGWLPEGLASTLGIFLHKEVLALSQLIISFAILTSLFIYAKKSIEKDARYRVVQVDKKAQNFRTMIMFLSEEDKENLLAYKNIHSLDDLLKGHKRYRWEMPVRGIMEHIDSLLKVYVICSPTSEDNFADFQELLQRLFNNLDVINGGQANFYSLRDVNGLIEKIYEKERTEGIKEEEIVVDITSGTKITSIAGCASTITYPNRYFQYVTSSDPKEVKVFNMDLID